MALEEVAIGRAAEEVLLLTGKGAAGEETTGAGVSAGVAEGSVGAAEGLASSTELLGVAVGVEEAAGVEAAADEAEATGASSAGAPATGAGAPESVPKVRSEGVAVVPPAISLGPGAG